MDCQWVPKQDLPPLISDERTPSPPHRHKGIPRLHCWMMFSLNLGIFRNLSAIISMLWIHKSHILRMIWDSFVVALILRRIHRRFFFLVLIYPLLYVFNFLHISYMFWTWLFCDYFGYSSLLFKPCCVLNLVDSSVHADFILVLSSFWCCQRRRKSCKVQAIFFLLSNDCKLKGDCSSRKRIIFCKCFQIVIIIKKGENVNVYV